MDSLYAQRVTKERLEESLRAAEQMAIVRPGDPDIQWRVARGLAALAYGYPSEESESLLLESIEWGRRCLRANPGWTSREELSGGRVTRRAALRLSVGDLPCLEALLTGWTRWIVLRGAAAHVDLARLEVLARRAQELEGEEPGWVAPWALGVAIGLSADGDRQWLEAERLLGLASTREPELATPRVDALYVQLHRLEAPESATGLGADLPTHATHPWSLENRRAVQRELQMRDSELPGDF